LSPLAKAFPFTAADLVLGFTHVLALILCMVLAPISTSHSSACQSEERLTMHSAASESRAETRKAPRPAMPAPIRYPLSDFRYLLVSLAEGGQKTAQSERRISYAMALPRRMKRTARGLSLYGASATSPAAHSTINSWNCYLELIHALG
jgi:hypothetical protein